MTARQPSGPFPQQATPHSRRGGRSFLWPLASVGLGALLFCNSLNGNSMDNANPAESSRSDSAAAPAPPIPVIAVPPFPVPSPPAASPRPKIVLPRSAPTRIVIPAISVDAPFTDLSLNATGQLNAPPPNDANLVGWFKDGVTPGERGTSIVAGHLDTRTGPAVFVELSKLKPGNTVSITRKDKQTATFKVDSVETFSKAAFPSARVYNDAPTAELRVITCGGQYDKKAKDYKDNVVVFAHLDSVKKA
ncbi:class F sortase [Streptomyces sp. NPDC059176]|uniref:class F sortase n=1 Tax=unclassified Streptomyces TaxID=2593676 RepID=UPI0036AE7FB9